MLVFVILLCFAVLVSADNEKFELPINGKYKQRHKEAIDQCIEIISRDWPSTRITDVEIKFKKQKTVHEELMSTLVGTNVENDIIYLAAMHKSLFGYSSRYEDDFDVQVSWHTDREPTKDKKYDFVQLCFHEMIHWYEL